VPLEQPAAGRPDDDEPGLVLDGGVDQPRRKRLGMAHMEFHRDVLRNQPETFALRVRHSLFAGEGMAAGHLLRNVHPLVHHIDKV